MLKHVIGLAVIAAAFVGVGYWRFSQSLSDLTVQCADEHGLEVCTCMGDSLRAELGAFRGAAAYTPLLRRFAAIDEEDMRDIALRANQQCGL